MAFIHFRNRAKVATIARRVSVKTIYLNKSRALIALLSLVSLFVAGCGGKEVSTTGSTTTASVSNNTTTGTTGAVSISLVDTTGAAVTTISSAAPAIVKATLNDTTGAPVANTVVTFTTDVAMGTLTPTGGTALTDASGVASVLLSPASVTASGAASVTAAAQIGGTTVTASTGYSIGTSALSLSTITLGAGSTAAAPLSAFGTTSVSVTVSSGGAPITSPQVVTFSSSCAGSGTAVLNSSVTTVNGIATASYRDNGCAGSDVITATLGGLNTSQTATIYVSAATTGSLQFVSATPAIISLRGTGGIETSQVAFKVLDGGGNPVSGKVVNFSLSTILGGITLTPSAPAQATSDSLGMVYINVNAGIMSTPVRVTATTPGAGTTILSTQSSQLTVTTGIPAQSAFSLSATTLNIEGWDLDGTTTTITARLADHFNNPPPDGTAVNFTSEGARVVGSCVTVGGDCSVTFNSQAIRPNDGRVTVLAYTVGEESFIDKNGNGVADKAPGGTSTSELIDILNKSTDMPEAWVDYNENTTFDNNEPYIDYNGNGAYDAADTFYNGALCDNIAPSSAGTCSTTSKLIHARDDLVIVLSGSTAVVTSDIAALPTYTPPTAPDTVGTLNLDPNNGTYGCGGNQTIRVKIVDLHGNLMPAGSTVTFASQGNGTVVGTAGSFPVENASTTIAAIGASTGGYNYAVTVKGDGSLTTTGCTDTTNSGTLSVTITTPSGASTKYALANLIN